MDTTHLRCLGFWMGIWRLKVPPKIKKSHVDDMLDEILPTRMQLKDKGV